MILEAVNIQATLRHIYIQNFLHLQQYFKHRNNVRIIDAQGFTDRERRERERELIEGVGEYGLAQREECRKREEERERTIAQRQGERQRERSQKEEDDEN